MNQTTFIVDGKYLHRVIALAMLAVGVTSATALALQVTPGRTEIQLTPGKTAKSVLTVTNDLPDPVLVDVSKRDWFVLDADKAIGVAKWLKVNAPDHFKLKAGETRQVPIKVECPKDALGELVAMVSFSYHGEQPSMITPMISVSVYLAAAGTEKVDGAIKEVAVGTWKGKLHLAALVSNTGNVHLRPTGKITILNAQNQPVASYPIAEGDPTYPGKDRGYFCAQPDIKLAAGKYVASAELTYKDLVMKGQKDFSVAANGDIQMDPEKTPKT